MLKKVWIKQFRNIDEVVFDFTDRSQIFFTGQNNQGKTNLLEALYFLGNGKSPLTSFHENMVQFDSVKALIGCDSGVENETFRVYGQVDRDGGRSFFLGDKKLGAYRQLKQYLNVDFLSADVSRVLSENASGRRTELDGFCKGYFSGYSTLLKQVERVVRQKNRTIKDGGTSEEIKAWNVSLVTLGSQLVSVRLKGLKILEDMLIPLVREMGLTEFGTIQLEYVPFRLERLRGVADDYSDALAAVIAKNFDKEIRAGYSLYGPTKDDFEIMINGKSLVEFYSKGINRLFAILLKLAEMLALEQKFARFPVLLLDDTFAELDRRMKQKLAAVISRYTQVFYTSVLEEDLDLFDDVTVYRVDQGEFTRSG